MQQRKSDDSHCFFDVNPLFDSSEKKASASWMFHPIFPACKTPFSFVSPRAIIWATMEHARAMSFEKKNYFKKRIEGLSIT